MDDAHTDAFPSCEIRDSRVFFGCFSSAMAVLAAGFAVTGWWLPAMIATGYAGWSGYRTLVAPVRVRVTEAGIEDRTFWYSPGLIPWDEILEVRAGSWGAIEIDLRDETSFWNELRPLARLPRMKFQLFYGLGPAAILPWMLRGARTEIVDALQEGLDTVAVRSLSEPEQLE